MMNITARRTNEIQEMLEQRGERMEREPAFN